MSGLLLGLGATLGASFAAPQPAAAQGLFESLFGMQPRHVRPQPLSPQASAYADPNGAPEREYRRQPSDGGSGGHGLVFCVRTCDGRYFPLQRQAGSTPAELCRSMCPTAKTMVFSGGSIDRAIAPNGTRYADLDNAFAYRDRQVESCTCNGKDGLGLARLDAMTDPTLRPGDIVATNEGLMSFRGRSSRSAEFTPIGASSSAWAQRLADIKVRPAPPAQRVAAIPEAKQASSEETERPVRRERRRAQSWFR